MIDDRNFAEKTEQTDKNKKKLFWRNFGIGALALALAILTIIVINVSAF